MTPDELVDTWRQATQKQLHRVNFDDVLAQVQRLAITFRVCLIACRDTVLAPWIPRVADLFRQIGFDVVVQDEVTADALLAIRREPPDVLLVWCTTNELQTFCTDLAAERSGKSHLLVCVPADDVGLFYCRLLREEHSVETVTIPVQKLRDGEECRFGLDLLIRCSDLLLEKVAITSRDARIKNTYVLLVHGIRTRALWECPVRATLEHAGLIAWPTSYSKLDVIRFILPFRQLRQNAINRVKKELADLKRRAPSTAEVGVIAHSFGSYIIGDLISSGYSFKAIAFSGSVLPTGFDFSTAGQALIVNEVGRLDVWPVLADRLALAYGATGTFGFNSGSVTDRIHASIDHSSSLTREFCSKYWVPFFCDGRIENSGEDMANPKWFISLLDDLPLLGWLFWLSFLVALCAIAFVCYLLATKLLMTVTAWLLLL